MSNNTTQLKLATRASALGAALFGFVILGGAVATAETPPVAKITAPAIVSKASDKDLANFKSNEPGLLLANPTGGAPLSAEVKSLVLADTNLVDDLIALAKKGNSLQANAIGSGIGQAAQALFTIDKPAYDAILKKVALAGLDTLIVGFADGTKETKTLSLGGSSGAGGGVGGATNNGSNSNGGAGKVTSLPGSFSTPNSTTQYPSGGAQVTCTSSASPARNCI